MKMRNTIKRNNGFVILFAVTISAILLSITLGIAGIALKEIKFGTSARDTNDAFFAADTGIECALVNDKTDSSSFPVVGPATPITCENGSITTTFSGTPPVGSGTGTGLYNFIVTGLGSTNLACANISVLKDGNINPPFIKTTVTAKGYNIGANTSDCSSSNPDRIERELQIRY